MSVTFGQVRRRVHTPGKKPRMACKSWNQLLQAIDRDWPNASEQDRIDFRDVYLCSISQKTGRAYGSGGVHDAMVVVRSFYQHCAYRGAYHGDIGASSVTVGYKAPIDRDALAHTRSVHVPGKINGRQANRSG